MGLGEQVYHGCELLKNQLNISKSIDYSIRTHITWNITQLALS